MDYTYVEGKKYLITTSNWFVAPDGIQYKSVWGTVKGIYSDEDTLGIKTNDKSSNWYVIIGNMIVAGCQVHYAIMSDKVKLEPPINEMEYAGRVVTDKLIYSRIYNADIEE